jgi:SAM-dependent methyltransferase
MYTMALIIMPMLCQTTASVALSEAKVGPETIISPEAIAGNKSPTLNGMGYVFHTASPVAKAFLEEECKPGNVVIEIGAGFSNIPAEALKRGVSQYVANDISHDHLQILLHNVGKSTDTCVHQNLILLNAEAPSELPAPDQKYDAILANLVIHFMTPQEIQQFILWAKSSLKNGGKMYVATASPYSKLYSKLLPEYKNRLAKGEDFSGHFSNIMSNNNSDSLSNYKQFKAPNEMVLFSRVDLIRLFQQHGMTITQSFSLKIPTDEQPEWVPCHDEESNVVGIIAVNE